MSNVIEMGYLVVNKETGLVDGIYRARGGAEFSMKTLSKRYRNLTWNIRPTFLENLPDSAFHGCNKDRLKSANGAA